MNRYFYIFLFLALPLTSACNKDEEADPNPAEMLATNQGRDWNWSAYDIGSGPAPVPTCVSSGRLRFYSDGQFQQRYPPSVTNCQNVEGTWRFLSDEVFVIQTPSGIDTFQLKALTENKLVFGRDSVFTGPIFGRYFVQYTYYR